MTSRPRMLAVLGLGLVTCAIAAAASLAPTSAPTVAPTSESVAGSAGLRAFIDPETGELRAPTAEELARIAAESPIAPRKDADIVVIEHANGMKSAVLDESFMSTSVAKIGPDGRVITECVTSQEEFDAFFASEPAPAKLEVR